MKVFIVSSNTLPAPPSGAAYIAGSALRAGHSVEIFECLFARDLRTELKDRLHAFDPDVVGVSIRLVHGYLIDETAPYNTRHVDLRPNVRQVIRAIREATRAPIILGGPGFNYYASDWLEYLGLDYGIRGEGDRAFPLFLEALAAGGDLASVPGCVFRQDGQIRKTPRDWVQNLDETAFPAYQLLDLERYQQHGISPAVLTKRGCAFRCIYCPYFSLEGAEYRRKSAARVVDEVEAIQRAGPAKMVIFCDNNFNIPKRHAKAICEEMITRQKLFSWGSGDLRPMGLSADFCQLMRESGCGYVNLSVESASDTVLRRMRRGYTRADVRQSLDFLEQSGIPYGVSLLIGTPGETPETIQETLSLIERYTIPLGTWVTVGVCLWTAHQEMLTEARQTGQLTDDRMLFSGANYLSPGLTRPYMETLIDCLRQKNGITVQVNQPYIGYRWTD